MAFETRPDLKQGCIVVEHATEETKLAEVRGLTPGRYAAYAEHWVESGGMIRPAYIQHEIGFSMRLVSTGAGRVNANDERVGVPIQTTQNQTALRADDNVTTFALVLGSAVFEVAAGQVLQATVYAGLPAAGYLTRWHVVRLP